MSDLAPTPEQAREAIRNARISIETLKGFLPVNVATPLISAGGKLNAADLAIDAWEARLRLENQGREGQTRGEQIAWDDALRQRQRADRLWELVRMALPIVEKDAAMVAAITRFAPLSPEDQAAHNSTESDSEKWLRELKEFEVVE